MMYERPTLVISHYNLVSGNEYSTYDENPFSSSHSNGNGVWHNPYDSRLRADESIDYDNFKKLEELFKLWNILDEKESEEECYI